MTPSSGCIRRRSEPRAGTNAAIRYYRVDGRRTDTIPLLGTGKTDYPAATRLAAEALALESV